MFEMIINYITYIRTGIKATETMDLHEFVYWWTTRLNTAHWVEVVVCLTICAMLVVVAIILIKKSVKVVTVEEVES